MACLIDYFAHARSILKTLDSGQTCLDQWDRMNHQFHDMANLNENDFTLLISIVLRLLAEKRC